MKHSIVFTSALGGFVLFDLAGFKIRILDKFIFWSKEVTDGVLKNSRRIDLYYKYRYMYKITYDIEIFSEIGPKGPHHIHIYIRTHAY